MHGDITRTHIPTFIEVTSFWYWVDFLAKNSEFFFEWFTVSASALSCWENSVSALIEGGKGITILKYSKTSKEGMHWGQPIWPF